MKQIGRHEVKEWLGSGATADVFLAFDPEISRTLAIKTLKRKHAADQDYVKRFLQESKAAGVLSHPNIVTIYDVGQIDENPYIVMEFVDGKPLDAIIAENGPFSIRATLSIGAQVADALDYAHMVGVVHRDIKPSNLLLLKNSETVKIADFGIARRESASNMEQTQDSAMLGTPQYMSPEQILGVPLDGRSDLFSLGAVLYLMVTGEKPFQAPSFGQMMLAITNSDPRPIRELVPDAPQGVQSIIQKLLARDPADRYQTGAALNADLLDQMQALDAFEQTASERSPKSIRKRLTASMAALAATVTITFGLYLHDRQSEVFTGLAIDSGASMTKLAASEIAESLIVGDVGRLEITVNSITQERSFVYLHIADREGTIVASSAPDRVGQTLAGPAFFRPGGKAVNVTTTADVEHQKLFNFVAPVTYADTRVGTIALGLSGADLESALQTSLIMLSIIALVTTLLVSFSAYFLIGIVSRPLLTVQAALKELSRGGLAERISHKRKDQVGDLYDAFNTLAEQIIALRPLGLHAADQHGAETAAPDAGAPKGDGAPHGVEGLSNVDHASLEGDPTLFIERRSPDSPMRKPAPSQESPDTPSADPAPNASKNGASRRGRKRKFPAEKAAK